MTHLRSATCLVFCAVLLTVALASVSAQSSCTGGQIITAKECAGDITSAEEKALFDLVNVYRTASGRPPVRLSQSLSLVANRRMLDLKQNMKTLTHSWSDCRYDEKDQKTWACMQDAPKRFNSGYNGQGYETLYRTSKGNVMPAVALDEWKRSGLHNSIILNDGMFKNLPWDELGIAIDGEYAALWFGFSGNYGPGQTAYSRGVSGLAELFTVKKSGGNASAATADGKIVLNMSGANQEITDIILKSQYGKLDPQTRSTAASVLKNLFPEWPDIEPWLDRSAAALDANQGSTRTKLVRKIAIEMSSGGFDTVRLSIKP